jgi:hypothetical protein
MGTITHGSARFERKLNTGDYSHKVSIIELSFAVNDGDDAAAVAQFVADIARQTAMVSVGEAQPNVIETNISEPPAASRSRAKKTEKSAAPLADPMAGPVPPTVTEPTPATVVEPSPPPASVAVDPMAAAPVVTAPTVTQPNGADMSGTPATAPTTPATDAGLSAADLTREVMKVMTTLTPVYGNEVAAAKCGGLITQFGGPGGVSKIPVDKQQEFLAALKVLA